MEYKSIKELANKIASGSTPRGGKNSYTDNGPIALIRSQNVYNNNFTRNGLAYINNEQAKKLKNVEIYKDDILINITGDSVARVAMVDSSVLPARVNQHVMIIRPEESKVNKYYLLAYLSSNIAQEILRQLASDGATRAALTKRDLENFKIPYLSFKTQEYIGDLLKYINEKIEINKNIIENLEELSQTLFKHWFVDFEFPNENGNPYKSSGGEMVDSELGKIPKGWECVYLKDIVHHKKDTFNPKKSNESEVKHFSLPAFDSGQYPTIDYVTDIKSNKWIIDENCILFSKMNPTTRRIWVTLYNENFLNVASSEFVVLKSDSSYRNAFIYNICISDKFNEYLVSNTTGSTNSRQRVKPDIAVQYRFAYNEEVSYLLSEKIEPYIEKIKIIREQNQNLTQLRDTLLPKLMSGEIEIPDDIEVNEDELSI
ncbi:restriction endonuclease subunit S [Staphylococcus pseudintermedius]|uniref:restriction endonuclease subunit S n=1 Tax=Staphylococcus pseudintermedius TaxID=283734 RepID=UPI000C70A586|nr:restriction endonuclease subunit S [Staphylococcus pseudintermedius]MDT0934668.1 restriction endonuclease subunit S [Staphylococcus pseudintermedius]PKW55257.1 restriction endonuclease subunit S [Staphylococcus pseudintermedius]WQJ34803.1 restriction endonuclease subunit S [Staphylococcus pseudintermedius]WQL30706.1 restriction endonuclease subunit S [Staphylococcus pseudintermedius]